MTDKIQIANIIQNFEVIQDTFNLIAYGKGPRSGWAGQLSKAFYYDGNLTPKFLNEILTYMQDHSDETYICFLKFSQQYVANLNMTHIVEVWKTYRKTNKTILAQKVEEYRSTLYRFKEEIYRLVQLEEEMHALSEKINVGDLGNYEEPFQDRN
jgi:hypothetical protein